MTQNLHRRRNNLNRIMFPRCLHGIPCAHPPPAAVIRLVKSDGAVAIYDRAVTASELMEEFPKHMVCRSDAFYIGQITPALSRGERLVPGHDYFLLPANFFQSALSFAALVRGGGKAQFEIEKTAAGGLRVKVTEEMIARRHREAEAARRIVRVCTTPQLKKEYEALVGRRRQWKPKLDTVYEKKGRRQRKILRKTKSNVV